MAAHRDKIISYRRAHWLSGDETMITLGGCITQARDKLPTVDKSTVQRGGGQILKLASIKPDPDNPGGHYLHITAETPGESASVVPKANSSALEVTVSTASPPIDSEYMDGDVFVYVSKDDVCLCSTNLTDSTVKQYLRSFFKTAQIRDDSGNFDLIKAANFDKIAMLKSQGVQEIRMKALGYKASTEYYSRKDQPMSLMGRISKNLRAFTTNEDDVTPDGIMVTLNIKVDKRNKGLVIGYEELETIAIGLLENVEDEDDFYIITKAGQKISPTQIFLKTPARITSFAKSVERDDAWAQIKKFYKILKSANALEE